MQVLLLLACMALCRIKPVDPGLIQVLRQEIVPRLLSEVPGQPSAEELEADPYRSRFVLVFDREGYSPAFFKEMWQKHRISCITYHKHPGELWSEEEFVETVVSLANGEEVKMKLAERGSLLGSRGDAVWVRETRKLCESGHQTSTISTAYGLEGGTVAARLFSRWCQENFFRYMMEHFAIDILSEYGSEPLHDTEQVVNPRWREGEKERNRLQATLIRRRAAFAALTLHPVADTELKKHQKWEEKKGSLLEEIAGLEQRLETTKEQLKQTSRHLRWEELGAEDRFTRPPAGRKRLLDTVRMIAYRAETGLCTLLGEEGVGRAAARRILQDLFATEADIVPEPEAKRLRVQVHRGGRPAVDRALAGLSARLNELETVFPGTELVVTYELVGQPPPEPPNGATETSQR